MKTQNSLYWLTISETAQIQKKETSFVEKGEAWRTEELPKQKSLTEDFQIKFVRV